MYGEQKLPEYTLSELEGEVAPILKKLVNSRKIPPQGSKERNTIVFWMMIQRFRTLKTADQYEQLETEVLRAVARNDPRLPCMDDIKVKLSPAVQIPLMNALATWPILTDLAAHLLVNDTHNDFVTSDHPVVLCNSYLSDIKNTSTTGLAASGLQLFYPLTPRHCLFMYDRQVYSVLHSKENVWPLIDENEVDAINLAQLVNAEATAYFRDEQEESRLLRLLDKALPRRTQNSIAVESDPRSPREWKLYRSDPNIQVRLAFSTIRPQMRLIPLVQRVRQIRNPQLLQDTIRHAKIVDRLQTGVAYW